jgi:hypothetical protein
LPILGVAADAVVVIPANPDVSALHTIVLEAFMWFVFGCVGLRLGSAGLKQTFTPGFTASELLGINDDSANHLVRELGFANICLGILGVASLFFGAFRMPAFIAGGLFFVLTGVQHLVRRIRGTAYSGETFPMVSDLIIACWLIILAVASFVV